jgi:hypothetical protein
MRKEYGAVLRRSVEERMTSSPFGWTLHREKSIYAIPGERAFRKDAGAELTLWCMVVPNQKLESFTIEVGWSRLARYPELSVRPSPGSHDEARGRDECLVRLGELSHGHDHWWEVEGGPRAPDDLRRMIAPVSLDDARARVLPVVDEALASLQRHGEPYLAGIE